MMAIKVCSGYTLIEVLIALAVFAILATITSSAMYRAFDTRARVNLQAERLNTLQLAINLLERDITQATERSVRGDDLSTSSAFVGKPKYVEFTRGGLVNPNAIEKRSTLKRVAFVCRKKKLIRRSWENLDMPKRNHYQEKVLLNHLDACYFNYISHHRQTLSEWRANALQQNQKKEFFPIALQLTLTLTDWGNMSVLFVIPVGLYAESN